MSHELRNNHLTQTKILHHPFADVGSWGVAYLSQALGAPPVTFGDIMKGRDQTKGVVAVVTPITKQESILIASTPTHQANILFHLRNE